MLTEKYSRDYIEREDKIANKKKVVNKIIKVEKETKIQLLDWNEDQYMMFLKSLDSISPASLNQNSSTLRDFVKFICAAIGDTKERLYILNDNMQLIELIDRDKLLAVTITEDQFKDIRHQLSTTEDDAETINYRNVLILELAWYGLTELEMKMIKISDIEFVNRRGKEIAILSIINDKFLTISDSETVQDIKETINQTEVIKRAKDGRTKRTQFRVSEYLLKGNMCGGRGANAWLVKPSITLKGALIKGEVSCDGINLQDVSIDDVRRSRLIFLLNSTNSDTFDLKSIAALYSFKNTDSMRWLRRVSGQLYPEQ